MRKLFRDRRGTVAFVAVVAAIPLIGAVALGGEAGSWYVTKQHAQNAADAAAYSGALACANAGSCTSGIAQPAGQPFALKNGFSNTAPQAVTITALTSWNGNAGTFVEAQVSQSQPTYLAGVLGVASPVNIGATGVAQVVTDKLAKPCMLALTGQISFQGSPTINAPNCGMATNDTANNALNFTGGNGIQIDVKSLSAAGGCTGSATFCKGDATHPKPLTYMPIVTNPLAALDTVMATANLLGTLPNCKGSLTAYSAANPCKNDNVSLTGNGDITLAGGVYFISGALQIKGNGSILGTGALVLLPGASLVMKGGGLINLAGNTTVTATQLPPALQANAALFSDMVIYDYQTTATADAIKIGGNSQITFKGNMYLPHTDVTFQGNPTVNANTCGNQLIANSLIFNGDPTVNFDFNNATCPSAIQPISQFVAMVLP